MTDDNEPFMLSIFDSTASNGPVLMIFTTIEDLRALSESEYWIVDGTFDVVPNSPIFKQLRSMEGSAMTEHGELRLLFTLFTKKTEAAYTDILLTIKDYAAIKNIELGPKIVIHDFEKAQINSNTSVFPEATSSGCYFHYCQALIGNINTIGLKKLYGEDCAFHLFVRKIAALAFLPPSGVRNAFEQLKQDSFRDFATEPLVKDFVEYFEKTWTLRTLKRAL